MCHVPSVVNDLWSQIYAPLRTRRHTMLLMRALEKQLQVITGLSWSSYNLRPNIVLANFLWVKCVRFSPFHDRDFRKRPGYFRIFRRISENFQTLPKFKCTQMFRKTLEHFRSYLKTANLACFHCVRTKKRTQSHHVFKNNLSEFVSQAWEIVLDAWDWCFWSSGRMHIQYSEDINFDWLI